jgi:hypothetical protein
MPRKKRIPDSVDADNKTLSVDRRRILQGIGVIGVGSALATGSAYAGSQDQQVNADIGGLERVEPGADPLGPGAEPPENATILWDGENATLDDWVHYDDGSEAEWIEHDDYFEVNLGTGDISSKEELGDCHLHVEWRIPEEYEGFVDIEEGGDGQGPGNSGVFLMETYEVQVLQSHDNPTYPGGYAGAFYVAAPGEGGAVPLVLPTKPPGEWNVFDIVWRGPRFDEDNELERYPQLTIFFNGVAVVNHYDVPGPNWWVDIFEDEFDNDTNPHPMDDDGNFLQEAPVRLQDHGADYDECHFRNIWYSDLPEDPVDIDEPGDLPYFESTRGVWEEREGWDGHNDSYDPDHPDQPAQIEPGDESGDPPEDADVLIDDLITIEPGDGDWTSDEEYTDSQIHVEYKIPEDNNNRQGPPDHAGEQGPPDHAGEQGPPDHAGKQVSSSGVLMMGDYEINIVDTWGKPVEADEWAGAYTHQAAPHHDAVREPGEWQELDIVWQSPRFEDGELAKPAQVTAFLNGVAVQTRLVVDGPNADDSIDSYQEHGEQPLRLREDGSEVQFRNTWVRPLESDELSENE